MESSSFYERNVIWPLSCLFTDQHCALPKISVDPEIFTSKLQNFPPNGRAQSWQALHVQRVTLWQAYCCVFRAGVRRGRL